MWKLKVSNRAVTGLLVVVSSIVSSTCAHARSGASGEMALRENTAKSNPSFNFKDVFVSDLPMDVDDIFLRVEKIIKLWGECRYLACFAMPNIDRDRKTIGQILGLIWDDNGRSRSDSRMPSSFRIVKFWQLIHLGKSGGHPKTNVKRWGLPHVRYVRREYKWIANLVFSWFPKDGYPSTLLQVHGNHRSISRIFGGIGGFFQFWILPDHFSELASHYAQLPMIDSERDYPDDSEHAIDDKLPELYPSELSRKFFGSFLLAIGSLLGIGSNFVLGWPGWGCRNWRLRNRLALWGSGWFFAIEIICHGTSFLLGID